jgi:methionyl-tRNA synthetase
MTRPRFYITTAIAYPNGAPHVGYAYEIIATDAIARFKALDGYDVYFLTGTDEHGVKMAQAAKAEGMKVEDFAKRNSGRFRDLAKALNLANDDFIRTTEPRHHKASQAIWKKMLAKGDIYLGTYSGWYSVRDEAYYDEGELSTGPDGKKLSPQGTPVEWVEEGSYFFRLSAYQQKLLDWYEQHPDFIGPETRRNEIVAFVKRGLQDLSISRTTFDWGVPVPDAPGHVMYVWVDALTNYITGVGYPDEGAASFKKFWPADVHIIGKDIIRFHTVYWPAFLMSAGLEVPRRVFAHGFLTVDGKKMSKSEGNIIDPFELVEQFGVDPVRYFFLREIAFGQDGDYSREKLINRSNADLANDLGNLAQRSLSMIAKNFDGKVPNPSTPTEADNALLDAAAAALAKARAAIDGQLVHEAVTAIWDVVGEANRYFAREQPWALKATDPARMGTILYVTAETVRRLAIPAQAFIPESAGRILDFLGVAKDARTINRIATGHQLAPGSALPAPEPVFKRFEREPA